MEILILIKSVYYSIYLNCRMHCFSNASSFDNNERKGNRGTTTNKNSLPQRLKAISEESANYLLGVIIVLCLSAVNYALPSVIPNWFFYFPLTFFVIGFLIFLYTSTRNVRGSAIAKVIVSLIVLFLTTVSYGTAKQILNDSFGVPASAFPMTHNIMSILSMPVFALLGLSGIGFIGMMALPLFFIRLNLSNLSVRSLFNRNYPTTVIANELDGLKAIFRYIALVICATLCLGLVDKINWYSQVAEGYTKWFAYTFEAEGQSYCLKKENEKVAYLSGDLLIIVAHSESTDSYDFKVEKCILALETK